MFRQIDGQRDLPIGTVVYIQDGCRPLSSRRDPPIRVNPWMIVGWLPRVCMGLAMRGGHLAVVRSLRDGRTLRVANWILRQSTAGITPRSAEAWLAHYQEVQSR